MKNPGSRSAKWLAALALAAAAASAPASAVADDSDPKLDVEKYTLDNGLEVILHQDNSVPLVAVNVWYHVGSGDERPGRSGFAHLFEHMLFQASVHVGEDRHFEVLKQIGASSVNGTTNTDRTNYFEVVPSHQLETALWLESDRMGYFLPTLTEKSFRNQVEVVRNEKRQSYDNRPYGKTILAIFENLYPQGHPYKFMTIGRHEDLQAASLEDVRNFYQQWYVPANATLTIAGDFDKAEVKKLIDKWFGTFPTSKKPPRGQVGMPSLAHAKARRVTIQDEFAPLRQLNYVWHSPAKFQAGEAELAVLGHALGTTGTGRLYKRLVHEEQLAQSVSVFQHSMGHSGIFMIQVQLQSDADQKRVETILDEEMKKALAEPISADELRRAVTAEEASVVWRLESLLARADTLQQYNHFLGDPQGLAQDLDRYRKLTPEQVQQAARQFLAADKRLELLTMPAAKGAAKAQGSK